MNKEKSVDLVDQEVGARVRHRRTSLGLSQTDLATSIGVTFQQVQKYEKGSNRISASRMQQIALALNLPAASFFSNDVERDGAFVSDMAFMPRDSLELNRAYVKLRSKHARAAILVLVKSLADRV